MQTLISTAIVLMVANLLLAYFIYRKISKKLNTMHQILDVATQEIDAIKRTSESGSDLFDLEYDGSIEDSLYEEAKRIVAESGKASASLLQRRLRVGYARSARLLDMLEEKGIIGPANGVEPREVLITK